ncbi:GGDEF domain-containing protein [Pseudoduganella sp. OTU4001]|uniref:GGDEF domain-containing protein n=1 Tax=Pseudoduganella sp. OTU4001 TaxID=3043854 RepID=UPI00313BBF4B
MFALDPFTVLFTTTLTCVVLAAAMYSVHLSFRREVAGVGHWACGLLAMVGAGILFLLRGKLTDAIALPGANVCLMWGIGLSMIGTRRFFGVAGGWAIFHGAWLLELSAILYWLLVEPNFPYRAAAFSFFVSVFYIDQLRLVWRHRSHHFTNWFFGILLAVQSLNTLTRGVAALFMESNAADLLRRSALANVYLAVANFMALLMTVAFLMLATRKLQKILEQRSTHDPLTGVLNRRGFLQFFGRVRARQQRSDSPLSLMAIDLDHFKAINDQHGHAQGDKVLTHVASVIMRSVRRCDYVARFGGEEFVVLLPETTLPHAHQLAQRIQSLLRDSLQPGVPACTVSIGLAGQQVADESLDSLISRADAALYRAKANGRNRAEIAAPGPLAA